MILFIDFGSKRLKCAFIVNKVCRMNRIFKKYLLLQFDFLNKLAFGVGKFIPNSVRDACINIY